MRKPFVLPTDSAAPFAPLVRVLEDRGGKVTLGAQVTQLARRWGGR